MDLSVQLTAASVLDELVHKAHGASQLFRQIVVILITVGPGNDQAGSGCFRLGL